MQELADLKQAAYGTTADKIRYFDNCVRRRLAEMHTVAPTGAAPFTWEQKRKLSVACGALDAGSCSALVAILAKHSGKEAGGEGEGEIVVDIGSLPDAALHAIQARAARVCAADRPHMRVAACGRQCPPRGTHHVVLKSL
jgi:Bromodomain extra-terminal - transcription regulation